MQASRFDQLVRSLSAASRRQVLKVLAGTAISGLIVRRPPALTSARQASLPCPPCLSCETCDPSTGECLPQCGTCEVCDVALDTCRPCAACEVCDEFTEGQCVPQCEPCETCDASIDTCRSCDPSLCETCDPVFGGCRACARCEKCDTSSGECLPDCPQCESCDPVLGVCRGCDRCRCEECDPATGQCRGCDPGRCERCDPESGSCVEGCSRCEKCDQSTGACLSRCGQCQECDPSSGKCRDCLPCEKCDEETGRCVSVCEQCLVCDPERGDCRPCADDRCEVCDETTGQCLQICCPGEQCDQGGCGQLRENCLTFEADGPNPRPEVVGGIPVVFDIYWPPGRPVPPYIRATSSTIGSVAGGMTGLNIGFLTTITLHQPVSAVELTLTHTASPVRIVAFAGSAPADTAAMNPAFSGALETLRLEGSGIDYLVVTAPNNEAHLTKLCVCRLPCSVDGSTCEKFILSGGPSPTDPIPVDDDLTVELNGMSIFVNNDGLASDLPPISFGGANGDQLRIVAADVDPYCRRIGPLYLHCTTTSAVQVLDALGQDDGCVEPGTRPANFIFYDQTFTIALP